MPKVRIYELAKQLNVSSKEIVEKMQSYGKSVNNQLSSLDDSDVNRLTIDFKKIPSEVKPNEHKPVEKAPEPSGGVKPRLGPDGKPIRPRLGPDGKPMRPLQLGPDGKPLRPRLGPDGKPLRPRLGPDGKPLRPPHLGPDGKPIKPKPAPVVIKENIPPAKPMEISGPPPVSAPMPNKETANKTPKETVKETTILSQPVSVNKQTVALQQRTVKQPSINNQRQNQRQESQRNGQREGLKRNEKRDGRIPSDTGSRPPSQDRDRRLGQSQNRQAGLQHGQGTGQSQTRPAGQGRFQGQGFAGRPAGPGQGQRTPAIGTGRPAAGNFARPAAVGSGRPGFGKKDDKKTEPTKDDRKQGWQKDVQMRSAKAKDKKDALGKKENQQGFIRGTGQNKKGQSRTKGDKIAVKRVMPQKVEPVVTEIFVASEITVRDLAEKLYKSNADIIKVLIKKGIMVTANQTISYDTAVYVAETFNVLVEEYKEVDVFEKAFSTKPDSESDMVTRPPVIVVMGHVDHGKTSLLDVIRDASVQQKEAGGITQHIGAYSVSKNGKTITFLDTPGHEAFTAMRMRGAQVTDIAILVVAANDGVMPQTIEAINHAKAAGVEIIVAINKMDLPTANPDKVKQELTEYGLQPEDWGGETITVPVSALKREGIDTLLEMIVLVAEMKELKANPNKAARGSIIEAKLDKGRGPVATVLVQDGTLRVGDPIVAGAIFGKIRAMSDDIGRNLKEAGPSVPVEIIGLSDVPASGDTFYVAEHEKQARQLSETVIAKGRENMIKHTQGKISLDDLFNQIQAGNVKDLNIVVKADVQGSVEALKTSLEKLSNEQVRIRIIHSGAGAITESDVMLASASNAIIIGFNVRPEPMAKTVAEAENVDLRMYQVIYSALDDITAAIKGMLDPEFRENVLGHAEIRQLFKASGVGTIGGSYVLDGRITRNAKIRIIRDGRIVYDGVLETLRRFKDDVREVAAGYECGLLFHRYNDIKEGDRVEAYVMEEIPR